MREIKFRAWNSRMNVMVTDNEDKAEEYWDGVWATDIGLVNFRLKYPGKYRYMQYTGLKDKNGKEIYEGDVVKFTNELDEIYSEEVGEIVFDEQELGYQIQYKTQENSEERGSYTRTNVVYLINHKSASYEVIGNIYESKE